LENQGKRWIASKHGSCQTACQFLLRTENPKGGLGVLSDSDIVVRSISVSLKLEDVKKANEIVEKRLIPGINNRSGLIEYALHKVFQELADAQRQKCQ
jgi:hypothetical protein